ncbi:MAG: motility associated factor glycosyltransferase family protein, partial [Spirochaetaceae bacterium]|nr:motility associated factor glycosyltransferase family protein [Spirochaetaceae bacterium]
MNIYTSAKGHLCAEQNGRNLHSQYNPVREAQRFVDSSIEKKPSIIVFLGAGLGYIQQEMALRFPETRIISIYYDDVIYNNRQFSNEMISSWSPSSGISIHQFFTQYILEQDLKNISIIEWNPSALMNNDLSLSANKFLKMTIQQLNGNIKTTAVFGKKWIRNMICNYLSIDDYCSIDHGEAPVVIASSGPTLTKSIPQIIEYRNKFVLWALPSSLATLNYHGVIPDLLISTDPGYYGRFHLYSLQKNIPVAQPLTGSRGIWGKKNPILVLNQSFPFEEDLLNIGKMKFLSVPSNGTVSGTALELALQQSKIIFFAGLDLCFNDILSHSRPHSFDNILQSDTHRLQPVQSVYYKRASLAMADFPKGIRISQSLD